RVRSVAIALRSPPTAMATADTHAADGPLDILMNNAAQTVRRTPGAYSHLVAPETPPLPEGPLPDVMTLYGAVRENSKELTNLAEHSLTPSTLTGLSLVRGSASLDRVAAGTAIDP